LARGVRLACPYYFVRTGYRFRKDPDIRIRDEKRFWIFLFWAAGTGSGYGISMTIDGFWFYNTLKPGQLSEKNRGVL
jgi:hypothetical protein